MSEEKQYSEAEIKTAFGSMLTDGEWIFGLNELRHPGAAALEMESILKDYSGLSENKRLKKRWRG